MFGRAVDRLKRHGPGARTANRAGTAALVFFPILFAVQFASALAAAPQERDIRRDAAVEAIERVLPGVVNIGTETIVQRRDPFEDVLQEFWGPFYRRRSPDAQYSLGSGVIIDEAGYVLTNDHVVRRANRVWVKLADGREFEADSIAGTGERDVALLRLRANKNERFTALKMARADDLLLGETVLALGNPFGLGGSVSRGILSSKTRRAAKENEALDVADWLQTDAAINPGNSGGPLINLRGEVIGLNVAVYREGQGIGFAIPVKRVQEALMELFTPENLKSLWFGAKLKQGQTGLTIGTVEPDSPAAQAGMRAGDVILTVNNRRVENAFTFNKELIEGSSQHDVQIILQRGIEKRALTVRLVPEEAYFNVNLVRRRLGLSLQVMSPQLAERFGLEPNQGLLIAEVDANSPASQADLEPGLIVQACDGHVASSVRNVARIVHTKSKGEKLTMNLLIYRQKSGLTFSQPAQAVLRVR